MYDYHKAVVDDVREHIYDYYTEEEIKEKLKDRENFEEELNEKLWICDDVTGNGSGSYYCNAYRAAEALMFNLNLLREAIKEFGGNIDILKDGEEACDVTIRCYLLGQAINKVLDEMEEKYNE